MDFNAERFFNLAPEQIEALKGVVDSISRAFETGLGVSQIAFAVEDEHTGFSKVLNDVAQQMYLHKRGLLQARLAEVGGCEVATGLGMSSLAEYANFLQEDAARRYRI